MSDQPQCQALQLSDDLRCHREATHADGLFCHFHAKQVFGLYKGYKRRNAQLDVLDLEAPPYLQNAKEPLANDSFSTINDENTLREVHSHLFKKYVLIGKVIDARKLHHTHFYSLHFDYGHQAYLDKLSSQRHTTLRALERLEKRTAEVLFAKEKWFSWVRMSQAEEEATREKEQKKIKQEAALFKRHQRALKARLALMRQREEQKTQEAFLDAAYQERMAVDGEDDEAYDPIDDIEDEKRNRFIDLIKHFLWMEVLEGGAAEHSQSDGSVPADEPATPSTSSKKKKSKAKGGATSKPKSSERGQKRLVEMQEEKHREDSDTKEPDANNIETEAEMRERLSKGVKKDLSNVAGIQMLGTMENPIETFSHTAPMSKDEVDSVISDIKEIKLLLFCRLLLSHASMLPAAMRASNVEEFLNDAEVTEVDLRDLCLKVEEPTLQDIRDACADFARGDEIEEDDADEDSDSDDEDETLTDLIGENKRYSHLHTDDWLAQKMARKLNLKDTWEQKKSPHKTKITVLGKTLWNHASEKAMSREGWLQFSIMAKDCNLKHAISLCRNWNEFSDLSHLTLWQFFPASNWASWGQNRMIQQLQQLGFYPYFVDLDAERESRHNQVGGRSQGRRQVDFVEARNIVVGHMKRNDPVTRRFLQYLCMRRGEVLVVVRDGKTGRVITAPSEEYLWTYRIKRGLGRASKNEWQNILEVGPDYFYMTDILRDWHFSFDEYLDVCVYDFVPGQNSMEIYNVLVTELQHARRIAKPIDLYAPMEHILRTLTRDKETMRTRLIKPGENAESLWDTFTDEGVQIKLFNIKRDGQKWLPEPEEANPLVHTFYNESSAAEDAVLFTDELTHPNRKCVPFREIRNGITRIEEGYLPSQARYLAKGLEAMARGENPKKAMTVAEDQEDDSIWAVPKVWHTALKDLRREKPVGAKRDLLSRTGLLAEAKTMSLDERLKTSNPMEVMERDRAISFKEAFHDGDLEPGATEKFLQVQEKINVMLKNPNSGSTNWIWLLAEILDWLEIRVDYDDYAKDPLTPWPHGFVSRDMLEAFVKVAMFFPESDVTSQITMFLKSKHCEGFYDSLLFDPKERSKTRPDRRTRTSYEFRDKTFWNEWQEFHKKNPNFVDMYPLDKSIALRPIVAHLYKTGIISPAYFENVRQCVSGMAIANTEPHRPGKLDMFISYDDKYGNFRAEFPPTFVHPSKWPQLLPHIKAFAEKHTNARFALLRLWSSPHYYPLMVGLQNRQNTSFMDTCGRSWEFKFVPKDMRGSEFSIHRTIENRLELLQEQFEGRVVSRGDLLLVMGTDADDLLKYCTAVTFAMQTKPWLREVDTWKSFINVSSDFFDDLDPYWLD